MTGWTVINNNGTTTNDGFNVGWLGNGSFGVSTPFGTDFIDLTGDTDTAPFDGVEQTISTVAGQSYALTFDLGVEPGSPVQAGPISVDASAGSSSTTFTDDGTSGTTTADGTVWTGETLDFTAASTSTVISIIGETGTDFIGVDNVSVNASSAVPEPGSGWLLLGAMPLAYLIRKRVRVR